MYSRGNGKGDLPYHLPRKKRARYQFDADLAAIWLTERRDAKGQWLRDPNVDVHSMEIPVEASQEGYTYNRQLRDILSQVLQLLPFKQEKVLRMRFGLDGREYTLEEIGVDFNYTREGIRSIEAKALHCLKENAAKGYLESPQSPLNLLRNLKRERRV